MNEDNLSVLIAGAVMSIDPIPPAPLPFACAHLFNEPPGVPVMALCISHPASGLLCADCTAQHDVRHEEQPACVFCGEPGIEPCDANITVTNLVVRHPGLPGVDAVLPRGDVILWGASACRRCKGEWDQRAR